MPHRLIGEKIVASSGSPSQPHPPMFQSYGAQKINISLGNYDYNAPRVVHYLALSISIAPTTINELL